MANKRRLSALSPEIEEPTDPDDELMFLCLGGGNEVGRSCHIIQYKGKTVMVSGSSKTTVLESTQLMMRSQKLDAGQHPAYDGFAALPYFDEFDLSTVDVLLISQYVCTPSFSGHLPIYLANRVSNILEWTVFEAIYDCPEEIYHFRAEGICFAPRFTLEGFICFSMKLPTESHVHQSINTSMLYTVLLQYAVFAVIEITLRTRNTKIHCLQEDNLSTQPGYLGKERTRILMLIEFPQFSR